MSPLLILIAVGCFQQKINLDFCKRVMHKLLLVVINYCENKKKAMENREMGKVKVLCRKKNQ